MDIKEMFKFRDYFSRERSRSFGGGSLQIGCPTDVTQTLAVKKICLLVILSINFDIQVKANKDGTLQGMPQEWIDVLKDQVIHRM